MKLKPPRSTRETLQLLSLFDPERGLDALFSQIDWSSATPRQIYHAVLGRPPESKKVALRDDGYSPLSHARAALTGEEFQKKIINCALDAFPEKKRLLFVHVPKCAGTDLIAHLKASYPWLHEDLGKRSYTSAQALLSHLKTFVIIASLTESIFVCGHILLKWYLNNRVYRYGDRIFSVVRHPYDIVISQVNYVFKRFFENPDCNRPDTRTWADYIEIEHFDQEMSAGDLRRLGFRILSNPNVVRPNYLCTFLGDGTAESAIELMCRCDIELTEVSRYNAWLKSSWGIESSTRANKSSSIIKPDDLDAGHRKHLSEICGEDIRLYELIISRMDERGDCRIYGPDLS